MDVYAIIIQRLAQDLKDMAAELGPFIQEEHAVVGQRYLTWQRYVTPTDRSRIRDGVVGRATRAGRDPRRAIAGEVDGARNARNFDSSWKGHLR